MKLENINHIVLSGGGMLGISYIGFFKYLEEKLIDNKNIKSISGCSAGSYFAVLYALGYKANELELFFKSLNFKDYLHINAESLLNFIKLKGLDSVSKLLSFIKKQIYNKTGNDAITFSQLKTRYNIEVQIGVTNLSKSRFEIMNSINSPDIPVYQAISASIAIPFVFEPIIIGDYIYCDGGIIESLPIEYIIDYSINENNNNTTLKIELKEETKTELKEELKEELNEKTKTELKEELKEEPKTENKIECFSNILGIYLLNQQTQISKDNYQTMSLTQYMSSIFHTLSSEYINKKVNYEITTNNKKYNKKIITFNIPCDIMTFIKLNASNEDIDNIINIAYNTIKNEFENI